MQTLTRVHGADILITDAMSSELGDTFALEAMPAEMVKGISEPLATFAVRGLASPTQSAS